MIEECVKLRKQERFVDLLRVLARVDETDFKAALASVDGIKGRVLSPELLAETVDSNGQGHSLGEVFAQIALLSVDAPDDQRLTDQFIRVVSSLPDIDPRALDTLRQRIGEVLERGLGDDLKGYALAGEYDRLFSTASIFTDIRPIFSAKEQGKISGYLIVHQLKVKYQELAGESELYIAATDAELRELALEIELAIRRGEKVRASLGEVGVLGDERIID